VLFWTLARSSLAFGSVEMSEKNRGGGAEFTVSTKDSKDNGDERIGALTDGRYFERYQRVDRNSPSGTTANSTLAFPHWFDKVTSN
jgi:hypothetical protein